MLFNKILCSLLVIAMILVSFLLYKTTINQDTANQESTEPPRMELVEDTQKYNIYRHTVTGCSYIVVGGSSRVFTPMVKADGLPFCN